MNGISNGDGTYRQLSDSDALVGMASDLPYPQKSITENIKDLFDTSIKSVTGSNCSVRGGYVRIGNVITVSLDITTTAQISSWSNVITGLPNPINNQPVALCFTNFTDSGNPLISNSCYGGAIKTHTTLSSGKRFIISGSYIAEGE